MWLARRTNRSQPPKSANNGNSNSWLCVKCEGTVSPLWGTGAKVRIKATIHGEPMWQLRLINAGAWAWGGWSFVAHFGLGDPTVVDTLRIEWTSGIVQGLHNMPVKQYLTVTEPPKLQMPHPGELEVQCWPGEAVGIEQSSRLQTWTPPAMVTNLNASGAVQWTNLDSPGPAARFYRAVRP